ncbi:hypothetical protein Tco_1518742 [Tanacetum coccineum]
MVKSTHILAGQYQVVLEAMASCILFYTYYCISMFKWIGVLLLAMKILLHLCVYYFATTIDCWIVSAEIESDLGRAARQRVCIHAGSDTPLSAQAVACCWIMKAEIDLDLGRAER